MSWRTAFFSVVPSPYQRDLFAALARQPEVDLEVFYLEKAAPDSPWPEQSLQPYEHLLPGQWWALGSRRIHANWGLPSRRGYDVVVLNTLMSITGQWLMRTMPRGLPWFFWGERLGQGGAAHRWLSAPLRQARGIAAIGSAAERDYRARFPGPRVVNLPYHCNLAPFQLAAPRPAKEEVCFLFCGQMIARKGVDLLLQALTRLDARARLLLVGREADLPGWLAELPAEVRARVEYAGFQAPDALPGFFARADVFVLPSRYDGWGVVVNQALGSGLPIICSDAVGAAADLVEPERNGLIVPAGEEAPLAAAMQRLLDEPATRTAWGANSREKAVQWTPEAGARKWVQALASAIAPAKGR
jgi:glycosyltransferase involved in cell wall biosynthesis